MWKYISKKQCNEILLSLSLIKEKDENKYIKKLYAISNTISKHYHEFKIKKHNGEYRIINEPSPILKYIQRKILKSILEKGKVSIYAKAYKKNSSLRENALPHLNKKIILKLDIKNFFDNISFYDVYKNCFGLEKYPYSVGMLLARLCTCNESIPQGSPTSSYISNIIMYEFDETIGAFCKNNNISYTRYSDDMTFSGNFSPREIIKKVRIMLKPMGFELNDNKIKVITDSRCQIVTGIVVNNKAQVSKKYRDKIRQELYYINKYGLESHLKK